MNVLNGANNQQVQGRYTLRAATGETPAVNSEPTEEYQGATLFNDEPMTEAQMRSFGKKALIVGGLGLLAVVATAAGVDSGAIEATSKVAHAGLIGGFVTGGVGLTTGYALLRAPSQD